MQPSSSTLVRLARVLSSLVLAGCAAQGCSLTADLESLQAGDAALDCGENEKVCFDEEVGHRRCVSLDQVRFGCDDPSCRPCTLVGALARCSQDTHKCVVRECKPGWADCDGDGLECEVDTTDDFDNCGACGRVCENLFSFNDCVNGDCVLYKCSDGWQDCDGDQVNGCEVFTGLTGPETNPCPE